MSELDEALKTMIDRANKNKERSKLLLDERKATSDELKLGISQLQSTMTLVKNESFACDILSKELERLKSKLDNHDYNTPEYHNAYNRDCIAAETIIRAVREVCPHTNTVPAEDEYDYHNDVSYVRCTLCGKVI